MKRFLVLMSTVLIFGSSTTLVAGSIVINNQFALAEQEDPGRD